jgi:hypothetical protein
MLNMADSDIDANSKTPLANTPLAVADKLPQPVSRMQPPVMAGLESQSRSAARTLSHNDDQTPTPSSLQVVNMHLGTKPDEPEVPAHGWQPHPLGLLACTAGGIALIAATFPSITGLTRPLSGLGLALGLIAMLHAAGGRAIRQLFPIAGTMLSGLTLLIAFADPSLLGPSYEVSQERSQNAYDPEAIQLIPLNLTPGGSQNLEIDGWADASRAAIQQGRVRVQILGAQIAPVQVVDSTHRYTKAPYLAVSVRVQHLGYGGEFRFVHWGEKGERTVAEAIATFNGGRLQPADCTPDVPLGVKYGYDLYPGNPVDDLLIFNVPAGIGPIMLELPGEAWDGHKAFRFLIPTSMIATQPGPKNR